MERTDGGGGRGRKSTDPHAGAPSLQRDPPSPLAATRSSGLRADCPPGAACLPPGVARPVVLGLLGTGAAFGEVPGGKRCRASGQAPRPSVRLLSPCVSPATRPPPRPPRTLQTQACGGPAARHPRHPRRPLSKLLPPPRLCGSPACTRVVSHTSWA